MTDKKKSSLEKQWAFWDCSNQQGPLKGLFLQDYFVADIYRIAAEGELLSPDQLKADVFFDLFYKRHESLKKFDQDLTRPVEPLNCVPWLEAILGLQLRVHERSVWAEHILDRAVPIEALEPVWSEEWLEATLKFVKDLIKEFSPDIPVAGPFLRGPTDIVAAMLGTDRFCIEMIDHPQEIKRLIKICGEAWVKVSKMVLDIIPEWERGYIPGARWIHAPGKCVYSSEDATVLISSKMYQKYLLPQNILMTSQIPYGFIHRHSTSLHNLEDLLKLPPGWAVEYTLDPVRPSVEKMIPILKDILEAKRPLILFGISEVELLRNMISQLPHEGLCVIVQAENSKQAEELLSVIR